MNTLISQDMVTGKGHLNLLTFGPLRRELLKQLLGVQVVMKDREILDANHYVVALFEERIQPPE